jgi:transposase
LILQKPSEGFGSIPQLDRGAANGRSRWILLKNSACKRAPVVIPFGGDEIGGAGVMMGRQSQNQAKLFYQFCLEDRVPADHLLRKIDRFLDLGTLRQGLTPFYSPIGRPSIDPELMIRMLVVGYCFGIRSERRLCEEVDLNLAYRWFCRLGLEGRVPDHSTFSKTRHGRFRQSDAFRQLFELVVQRAIAEGLVDGEGFAVDASLIAADANKQRSFASTDQVDWQELAATRRSVREYLDKLDEAAWGAASDVAPKFISPSDPAAQWTGAHKGHAFFAYADNYLIDLKAAIIVDVEATRANRRAEVGAAKTMIDRTEACFGLKPQRLSADSAYGSAEILEWILQEKQIAPHVPVWDKGERIDGTFVPTSSSMQSRTPIPVRAAKFCSNTAVHLPSRGAASQRTI